MTFKKDTVSLLDGKIADLKDSLIKPECVEEVIKGIDKLIEDYGQCKGSGDLGRMEVRIMMKNNGIMGVIGIGKDLPGNLVVSVINEESSHLGIYYDEETDVETDQYGNLWVPAP